MPQYKFFMVVIQVILAVQHANGGFERTVQAAAPFSRGFSGAGMYSADNVWINPASLSKLPSDRLSVFYSPLPFHLEQLSSYGLQISRRSDVANVSLSLNSFGFSLYRESAAGLTIAGVFTDEFSAGMSLLVNHLSIQHYGSSTAALLDIGIVFSPAKEINIGWSLSNCTGSTFGEDDDIPQLMITGLSYRIADAAILNCDVVKDQRYPVTYRAGTECFLFDGLVVRAGVQGDPERISCGFGVRIFSILFDYGISMHTELGFTHTIALSIQ